MDVSGAATCLDCALVAFSEGDGTMVEFLGFVGLPPQKIYNVRPPARIAKLGFT